MAIVFAVPDELELPPEIRGNLPPAQELPAGVLIAMYKQETTAPALDVAGTPWRDGVDFSNSDDLKLGFLNAADLRIAPDGAELNTHAIGRICVPWKRLLQETSYIWFCIDILVHSGGTWAVLPLGLDESNEEGDGDEDNQEVMLMYDNFEDEPWPMEKLRLALNRSIWVYSCVDPSIFLCGALDLDSV